MYYIYPDDKKCRFSMYVMSRHTKFTKASKQLKLTFFFPFLPFILCVCIKKKIERKNFRILFTGRPTCKKNGSLLPSGNLKI